VPLFAKHREPVEWHALRKLVSKVCFVARCTGRYLARKRARHAADETCLVQVLLVTFAMAVLVAAILAPLAHPIVSLVFERQVGQSACRRLRSHAHILIIVIRNSETGYDDEINLPLCSMRRLSIRMLERSCPPCFRFT